MAESVVCSYIRCYCEKNGIENYETHSSYIGGSVTAFLDIGKNKCLSIYVSYNNFSYELSAFTYFLKNVIKFEEIPVNAYISRIPISMRKIHLNIKKAALYRKYFNFKDSPLPLRGRSLSTS